MESTGVYWIPVWNILERGTPKLNLLLVNPSTVRALQGNKTDRIDAHRIAEYLQYGLLRGSFVPAKPVRQLRELTRMRVHIQQDRNRVINRIARLLETVNIKLGSVATNVVGKSGRAILRRLARGTRQQPEELAQLARTTLRAKIPDLILALDGRPDRHFRWMLERLLDKLEWLDGEVAAIDAELCEQMRQHEDLVRCLCTIPGLERITARVLVSRLERIGFAGYRYPRSSKKADAKTQTRTDTSRTLRKSWNRGLDACIHLCSRKTVAEDPSSPANSDP
jgi:transposase